MSHENGNSESAQKRLALVCQHFYPEMISTGLHMTELATGLAARGFALRVYCAPPAYGEHAGKSLDRHSCYQGVEIVRLPSVGNPRGGLASRGLFSLLYLLATWLFLLKDHRELAGIITTTNPPFIGVAAVLARLPYVTIVYDVYPEIAVRLGALSETSALTSLWAEVTRFLFNRSDKLVVIGRDMAEIVASKVNNQSNERIRLIPNWSDERRVKPVKPEDNTFVREHDLGSRFVIQYSGRMGRTHNLEPLLEAAELLQNEEVLFQFIGDGAKRDRLIAIAEAKGLKNVQFLPYQPFERLDEVLSAPELAVVCLQREITGLSVPSKTYGIMAAGKAILGFVDSESEIAQVIEEEACGVVLPEPNGSSVAEVIQCFRNHPKRLAQMGSNGRRAFLEKYSLSKAVDRYERLLIESFF